MAVRVRVLVLSGNGVNCERETAYCCRIAGADQVDVIPLWDVIAGARPLSDYDLLCLPGGFSDGDDLGAAQATANRIRHARTGGEGERLLEALDRFVRDGKLVIGICNGFQLLVKLGLLPWPTFERRASLTWNASGRFEARWVALAVDRASPCVFTRGIERIELPVRHGEGRLVLDGDETGQAILEAHLIPLRYADPVTLEPTAAYPHDPNGSWQHAAGLCDPTGRIFGLMPHPEAFLHRTNHPRWTSSTLPDEGLGVALFRNAVDHLRLWA